MTTEKIKEFFKEQKKILKEKDTILPKDIQDYTESLLDRLEEGLLEKLSV